MTLDVLVLGLGGMGSAALMHLAARGLKAVGLEQFSPAHAQGSSHGQSRIIRQAYFEDPAYVPLLMRAYALWSELEAATGAQLFVRTGGLFMGYPGSEVVEGSLLSAREHGLPHQLLTAEEIRQRFPAIRPEPEEVALYEENAGLLFPERCILAHLEQATRLGAEARFGVRVDGWRPAPDGGVVVESSSGEIHARKLVVTAGAWSRSLLSDMELPLKVERNVMHWFAPTEQPELYEPGRLPVYVTERRGQPVFYGFPALPGEGVKIGIHHSEVYTSPEAIDRQVSEGEVAAMRAVLAGWLPGANGAHQRSTVCMYTNTPDGHFVIGLHPTHANVVVAGGFSGHGFKFCSVVGEVLADLAAEGTTRHPIGLFSPARFGA